MLSHSRLLLHNGLILHTIARQSKTPGSACYMTMYPQVLKCSQYMFGLVQVLLSRADKDYPKAAPPPLRFIRSCSSALAPATLHKLEAAFGVPVLEVRLRCPESVFPMLMCPGVQALMVR